MNLNLHRKSGQSRGFTLVELMVVMVIISLIMALVGTSMARSVSGAEARAATRKLVASLRYTRARAILDKKGAGLSG
jgi:general secretion pathway protein H